MPIRGNPALQRNASRARRGADTSEHAQAALDADRPSLRSSRVASCSANGIELEGANVVITNVAPDEGLSAPFNSWFTLFGQFFDHGLDLVAKGGSGTVFIPLLPDDPLYVPTQPDQFHGADARDHRRAGRRRHHGDCRRHAYRPVNTTTSFVDQNQTYTSHPSHQVFLREYVLDRRPTR